jgi:hypothetical protein
MGRWVSRATALGVEAMENVLPCRESNPDFPASSKYYCSVVLHALTPLKMRPFMAGGNFLYSVV